VAPEVRHPAVRQCPQVSAEHDHAAVARGLFAQDEAQARGLAGARRTDEEHELPALHCEDDLAECGLRGAAIALRDGFEPDHGLTSLSAQAERSPSDTRRGGIRLIPAIGTRCQSSSDLRLRQRMPAEMKPSRSPSKTIAGLPTS